MRGGLVFLVLAKNFEHGKPEREDYHQENSTSLIKALNSFEPEYYLSGIGISGFSYNSKWIIKDKRFTLDLPMNKGESQSFGVDMKKNDSHKRTTNKNNNIFDLAMKQANTIIKGTERLISAGKI